jgi:hypothetical protein
MTTNQLSIRQVLSHPAIGLLIALTLHMNEQIQITRGMGVSLKTQPIPAQDVELVKSGVVAYASVSGSAISGGTASEYGVEQISNKSRFGRLP